MSPSAFETNGTVIGLMALDRKEEESNFNY
jgi:hypothetical protein